MYGTDTFTGSQTFKNNSTTYAAMYFPKADVTVYNNGDFYGSIIAKSVTLQQNTALHYDEALGSLQSSFDPTRPFTVKSWQEKNN